MVWGAFVIKSKQRGLAKNRTPRKRKDSGGDTHRRGAGPHPGGTGCSSGTRPRLKGEGTPSCREGKKTTGKIKNSLTAKKPDNSKIYLEIENTKKNCERQNKYSGLVFEFSYEEGKASGAREETSDFC